LFLTALQLLSQVGRDFSSYLQQGLKISRETAAIERERMTSSEQGNFLLAFREAKVSQYACFDSPTAERLNSPHRGPKEFQSLWGN